MSIEHRRRDQCLQLLRRWKGKMHALFCIRSNGFCNGRGRFFVQVGRPRAPPWGCIWRHARGSSTPIRRQRAAIWPNYMQKSFQQPTMCLYLSLSLQSVTWLNSDLKCFHEFHRTHETRVREIHRRDSQLAFRTDSSTSAWLITRGTSLRPLRNWEVDCFGSRRKNQSMFEQFRGWLVLNCH